MYFHHFADFIAMGKHGPYVWSAYGITLVALMGIHYYNRRKYRHLQRILNSIKESA